jgi:hypothetical protein
MGRGRFTSNFHIIHWSLVGDGGDGSLAFHL